MRFVVFSILFSIYLSSFGFFQTAEAKEKSSNRAWQERAHQAFEQALSEEAKSFLNISPTATGKTSVLAQALKSRVLSWEKKASSKETGTKTPEGRKTQRASTLTTIREVKKISIIAAHQLELVKQLAENVLIWTKDTSLQVVHWSEVRDQGKSFTSYLRTALRSPHPTAFVATTQSLKLFLDNLSSSPDDLALYHRLAQNLDAVYVDEAHHFGAPQTKEKLSELIETNGAFLYGATATPFHSNARLIESEDNNKEKPLFERSHWSYMNNKKEDLFKTYKLPSILDQLSIAISQGDIAPFNDLYVIGEDNFQGESLFVQGKQGSRFVLNPAHYERLSEILLPILLSNQKGFIVTATIAEAERLGKYLGDRLEFIDFDVYHSELEKAERERVLEKSHNKEGSHYIVAVKSLDEGVNLPHLSAYIDLNFSVPVRQMIQRIGRVLRLYEGKESADVLLLLDYKNEIMIQDLLEIFDKLEVLSFRGRKAGVKVLKESGDLDLTTPNTPAQVMSREELLELRQTLKSSVRKFWSSQETSLIKDFDVLKQTIIEYNNTAPENERILSLLTYQKYYKRIPGAPSAPYKVIPDFAEKGKWLALLGIELIKDSDVLKQTIIEYNNTAPENERILSPLTYQKYYKRIPGAPSAPYTAIPDFAEKGGFSALLGIELIKDFDVLKQTIIKYNKTAPENERILSKPTYQKYYKRIPGAPSKPNIIIPDFAEKGGFSALLGKELFPTLIKDFDVLKQTIIKYNKTAPENERILSKPTYQKYYKRIPGAPGNPYTAIPDFAEKGGFSTLLGKELIKDFDMLKQTIIEYNNTAPENERILSQSIYKMYYKRIPRAPSKPNRTIPDFAEKGGFSALLGKEPLTTLIKDFDVLKQTIIKYNKTAPENERILSQPTYKMYYKRIPGAPGNPYTVIPDFAEKGGFSALLGKEPLTTLIKDFDVLKQTIIEYNNTAPENERILSQSIYKMYYKRIPRAPSNPNRTIPDFVKKGGFPALLGKELFPILIKDFDVLKQTIIEYNNTAPENERILSSPTYKMYYKRIPGAPRNPYTAIPDFAEKGGFSALLGKEPLTTLIKDFDVLKQTIIEYNNTAPENERILSQSIYKMYYKRIPRAPSNPNRTIPDFVKKGGFPALLGKELFPILIKDFDVLKQTIIEYNNTAPENERILSSPTYKMYYKRIPGAPRNPYTVIPDFVKKGGFSTLRYSCKNLFSK